MTHSKRQLRIMSNKIDIEAEYKEINDQIADIQSLLNASSSSSKYVSNQKSASKEFLDNHQYTKNGVLRYEKIFGKHFISTGGINTTRKFVEKLNLKKGQNVLDVGCMYMIFCLFVYYVHNCCTHHITSRDMTGGIGGSAFYMAKELKRMY